MTGAGRLPVIAVEAASARPRRPRLASLFCGGVLATGLVLWSVTSRLPLLPPSTSPSGYRSVERSLGPQSQASNASCQCLLQLHCPRYSLDNPQQQQAQEQQQHPCRVYRFHHRAAKSCMQWRLTHIGRSTHVVLLGDLRLFYMYRYMRDELLCDTERIDGPAYCRSVHKNWTHPYLKEDDAAIQPPQLCHHLSISKLAKLEYYWTDDSRWDTVVQQLLDRCRLGACPSVLVVSSRLDLALRAYEAHRELSLARLVRTVKEILPKLEQLRAYGVHVWWKPQENLLDIGTVDGITACNEIIQQHNLRLLSALSASSVPVWTSTAAIGWSHHQVCIADSSNTTGSFSTSADFRCSQPYYLGNWAQQQYMDVIFNFLCGKAQSMEQNPCCAGWT